jgi:hypothetical protein
MGSFKMDKSSLRTSLAVVILAVFAMLNSRCHGASLMQDDDNQSKPKEVQLALDSRENVKLASSKSNSFQDWIQAQQIVDRKLVFQSEKSHIDLGFDLEVNPGLDLESNLGGTTLNSEKSSYDLDFDLGDANGNLHLGSNADLGLADYPFRNTSLSWEIRVNNLVSLLTLEELQLQLARGGHGPTVSPAPAVPRLGVGPYSWNTECLRGDIRAGSATSFPMPLGLAATFR